MRKDNNMSSEIVFASSRWMPASLPASYRAGDGAIHLGGYWGNDESDYTAEFEWLMVAGFSGGVR